MLGKEKPPAAGGAGSLPAASPLEQDNNSKDFGLDSKPKKGIIFEICSEDGFHIRSESIEGEAIRLYSPKSLTWQYKANGTHPFIHATFKKSTR